MTVFEGGSQPGLPCGRLQVRLIPTFPPATSRIQPRRSAAAGCPIMNYRHLLASIALLCTAQPSQAAEITGPACVHDGDTLRVNARRAGNACLGGTPIHIKAIAAPELTDPGGIDSREALKSLVEGKTVICETTGEFSHDRQIGFCSFNKRDVGAEMVALGQARECPRWSAGRYRFLEASTGYRMARIYELPGYCRPR